jgi:putative DNA modification/repair radical SAM protein
MQNKLNILAGAAKYDVSCSSSGSNNATPQGGMGNTAATGICHSFTEDGRCVSLLKLLLTNVCIYDCAYCMNRRTNDIPRATFKVSEVVNLTLEFYQRNFIEGLFLSSGIIKSPDYTMEALVRVARELRTVHHFGGYIHLKAIPGASPELIEEAGRYADRLSVNIEIPSEPALQYLAPEKNFASVFQPMNHIREKMVEYKAPATRLLSSSPSLTRHAKPPRFVPAGQTTQMIIGASPESDFQILTLASGLYQQQQLKRVYYSGYIPINQDHRLPVVSAPPLKRENRLYQADWLMRFYHFRHDEILDAANPFLDPDFDPKMVWAMRHPELFPLDINNADYEMILRIPGVGVRSAKLIIQGRRFGRVRAEHLKRMGVALKRAKYFITDPDLPRALQRLYPEQIRATLLPPSRVLQQISFLDTPPPQLLLAHA